MASDLRRGPPFNDVDGGAEGTTMGHLTVPPPDQKEYLCISDWERIVEGELYVTP